jgi:hypothetical protein
MENFNLPVGEVRHTANLYTNRMSRYLIYRAGVTMPVGEVRHTR